MIAFDLNCAEGHRFEGWFGSSTEYEEQRASGLLVCPQCGCGAIGKAPMAPAVPAKGNARIDQRPVQPTDERPQPLANAPMPDKVRKALVALAKAQAEALKDSTWVGDKFADQSRAMFYGEREEATIHGQASLEEAKALAEEGVPIAPLPFPVAPPEKIN